MSRLNLDDDLATASAAWLHARIQHAAAQADMVDAVRRIHAAGVTEVQLAAEFNTTRTTIRHILGKPRSRR